MDESASDVNQALFHMPNKLFTLSNSSLTITRCEISEKSSPSSKYEYMWSSPSRRALRSSSHGARVEFHIVESLLEATVDD